MAQKNYATVSSCNDTCFFRKDYSYVMNGKCLECKFCYNKIEGLNKKTRTSSLFDIELEWNDSALKVPVTVSRYCDPLYNEAAARNSIYVIKKILENNGQVIFRTAIHNVPQEIYDLAEKYKDNFMFQGRSFSFDSDLSFALCKAFAPGFSKFGDMLKTIVKFKDIGVDVSLFIDPYILGINEGYVFDMIDAASDAGVSKLTVKQLFATDYFKSILMQFVPRYSSLLTQKLGDYWTYQNEDLLVPIHLIQRYVQENSYNIELSVCNNAEIRDLICSKNCCLYDNAGAIYTPSGNSKRPDIKELK